VLPVFGELNQGTKSLPRISLQPCEVPGAQAEVKQKALCGTYEVFEDRVAKRGRTIAIKILVFHSHHLAQEAERHGRSRFRTGSSKSFSESTNSEPGAVATGSWTQRKIPKGVKSAGSIKSG
jgi:hypothetical protein